MPTPVAAAAPPGPSDEVLARQAARGDMDAFEAFYQRHSASLFDFVVRTTRDSDVAADIVQESFVKMWESLPGLRNKASVRSWLFSIARNRAIDHLRVAPRNVRMESNEEPGAGPAFALVDWNRATDPSVAAADQETAQLVWDAAASLSPEDYTLLDLHIRQGFEADELTAALGLGKGAVYTRLTRLRKSLGDAVVALLLVRSGRRECPRLDAMLATLPTDMPARDLNRRVMQHASACPECRETRRRLVAPLVLFGSFAPVPFPSDVQVAAWSHIQVSASSRPQVNPGRVMSPRPLALVALAGVALLGLAGWLLFPRSPEVTATHPLQIRSVSHSVGVPSRVLEVQIAWEAPAGAGGFAILWDQQPRSLPAASTNLPAVATGATSSPLAPGEWFVHVRVLSEGGEWAEPVHAGPFVIIQPGATPAATTTLPTATVTRPTAIITPEGAATAAAAPSVTPRPPTVAMAQRGNAPVPVPVVATATPFPAPSVTATSTATAALPPSATPAPAATNTPMMEPASTHPPSSTNTLVPPTSTPLPPTRTQFPPTSTPLPPTSTQFPPSSTPLPPTSTQLPPTSTPLPPTSTQLPPTSTPLPPTSTQFPPTSTPTTAPPTATPTSTPTGEVPSA